MMPATVPTACSWSGVGSSSWGSRCRIVPSGRWVRAASWAAAMVRIRPRLSGTTTPGNSTTLRTGTMTIASSGIGGMSVPRSATAASADPAPRASWARAWLVSCSLIWSVVISAIRSGQLAQRQQQAAVGKLAAADLEPAGRQLDVALEPSIRDLEAPDHRAPGLAGHRPHGADDQRAAVDHHLQLVWPDARQRYLDRQLVLGLEHVGRRLPD